MPYAARAIANFFIELGPESRRRDLTPMKVQKLVYFAHGWNLAVNDGPLIREAVEAWPFGPVVPDLYQACKGYGNRPVAEKLDDWDFVGGQMRPFTPEVEPDTAEGQRVEPVLKRVWDLYDVYTPVQLSNSTHEPGTPWHTVAARFGGIPPKHTPIPNELIREFFRSQAVSSRG